MRPYGVFGGMFDPVHYGHLRAAFELMELLDLEGLCFLPAGDPPHRGPATAPARLRLEMLREAIAGEPRFTVDERELRRAGPSYTVTTLEEMRAERGGQPLALLLGMDAYAGIGRWHRPEALIGLAHLVIAARPGAALPSEGLAAEWLARRRCVDPRQLAESPAGLLYLHQGMQLDVSSSAVRRVLAEGRDPRYLMPEAVRRIIGATGIYARRGSRDG